jgi:3'-5' exoribonuclease
MTVFDTQEADIPGGFADQGPLLAELGAGQEFVGFFLARNPRLDPFRDPSKGKYLRLQLRDCTGTIQARIWDGAEAAAEVIKEGVPIKVAGVVEVYNGQPQVQIERYRAARPGEFDPSRLLASTSRDTEVMWRAIMDAVQDVRDPHLAALLRHFFLDTKLAALFAVMPAARVIHHAYRGGLLEHCYELLLLAEPLLELYPEIDRDLLVTGILLHDIGKLEEYAYEYDVDVTIPGKLIGHVVLSERAVSVAIRSIDGFPPGREMEVTHLILAHHGRYEWGSPRRPKSLEAAALHYLDNLDAQINRFNQLIKPARENGQSFTQYDRLLGRVLYAGDE